MYPMNIGGRYERLDNVEMVVHLASPVALDGNMGHSLALHFFLVLSWPRSLPFSSLLGYRRSFCHLGPLILVAL